MSTFHVDPVRINVHVEVLVQILLCGAPANLFDLQETSAPRPLPMCGLSCELFRQREGRDARLLRHRGHSLPLAGG